MDESVEVLAFGAHPDDVEIGLGGCLAKHAAGGVKVGVCDLTRGELGSNGTPEVRAEEAAAAGAALGLAWRENLELPDGGLDGSPDQVRRVVEVVRRRRPRVVALPYWQDRHPDHVAASRLVARAVFDSGLRRIETGRPAWRVEWACHYFINDSAPPSFVVDVSAHYERKRAALACHRSQFLPADPEAVATRLTSPQFMQLVESRDAQFGALAGVAFAEGIVVREPVQRDGLFR